MAPQTETFMLLKVDLDCSCCYKKVKKLLCSIPEIKDQEYKEKENTVKIKVVCCRPERIRDKLRCKGGKSIISIDILEPPKPKPADPPKPKPADPPKCKLVPVLVCPPPQPPCRPTCCSDCYEGRTTGPCYNGFGYGYGYEYGYGYSCPTPLHGCPPPRGCGSRPVGYCVVQENPSLCAIM